MRAPRILVVDDDASIRRTLVAHFGEHGMEVLDAKSAEEALNRVSAFEPDMILTDVQMSGMTGLDLMNRVLEDMPEVDVIVFTGFAGVQGAIDAIKGGAYDYLSKPLDLDQVDAVVQRCVDDRLGRREVEVRPEERSPSSEGLVGRHPAMLEVCKTIGAVADSRACVLIRGETGTGKELVARTIHRNSATPDAPFIPVNCTAIPETLLESELFGHVRGAFTGADRDRRGRFELAGPGTIFLDEVGDMSLAFQAKLLRVLQEREFYPLGSECALRTEARVIAATHRPLQEMLEDGRFREDLYFRLKVVEIRVPPLRERRSDIPLLVRHLLSRIAVQIDRPMPAVSSEAMAMLIQRDWPGNVRELENVLTRAVVLGRGPTLTLQDLQGPSDPVQPGSGTLDGAAWSGDGSGPAGESLEDVERRHLQHVLLSTGGNKTAAARILQISRPTLHRKIKDYRLLTP